MPNFDAFLNRIEQSKLSSDLKAMWTLFVQFMQESDAEKDQEISNLKEEVSNLRDRLQNIEEKQDGAGQYSRLDTLIISPKKDDAGTFLSETVPTFDKAEDTKEIVIDLIKHHLKLNLKDTDISIAHRLQPPRRATASSEPSHDRRNIIVRFCRKDLIGTIFKHCKNNPPPFYINESLTPLRNNICYALRTLKKKYPAVIEKVRSFKGCPQAFINPTEPTTPATRSKKTKKNQSNTNQTLTRIDISTWLALEKFAKDRLETTLQEERIVNRIRT